MNKIKEILEEIHGVEATTEEDFEIINKLILDDNKPTIKDGKVFDEGGNWVADVKEIKNINECDLYEIKNINVDLVRERTTNKIGVKEIINFLKEKEYFNELEEITEFEDLKFNGYGEATLAVIKSCSETKEEYSIAVTKLDIKFKELQYNFLNEEFGLLELDNKVQSFYGNESCYDSNIETVEEAIVEGETSVSLLATDNFNNRIVIEVDILDDYEDENINEKVGIDNVSIKVTEMWYL